MKRYDAAFTMKPGSASKTALAMSKTYGSKGAYFAPAHKRKKKAKSKGGY